MPPLLQVDGLAVRYGPIQAVRGVSFALDEGEVVTLIGANGAGKSSVLRAISGVVPCDGTITYRGEDLRRRAPHRIVAQGIAHVPEGRGIFPNLTVEENLRLATWPHRRARRAEQQAALARVFELFPRVRERLAQMAGTLSGGEQQMLAVGRALVSLPRLILLDEPCMGLAPKVTQELFAALARVNAQGVAILLVEQNAHLALAFASRGLVLENGALALAGPARALAADERVRALYLGH
ncbi:MAG: ABC transporter ATP-binding protein [Candidatus Binatia bacterium]